MFRLFKDCFKKTNDCIIVATPLVVFMSILGWYFEYALSSVDSLPKLIVGVITMLVMFCGCLSAWLYMVKKTLRLSSKIIVFDKDRAKELLDLLLSLSKGIGRLFLPILGIVFIYLCVYGVLSAGLWFAITKYAGTIDLTSLNSQTFFVTSQELIDEMRELSGQELLIINLWNFGAVAITAVVSFLTIFWFPAVVYGEKNPFKALVLSIKGVFKTFKRTLGLFIYIVFLAIFISILNTFLMFNPFLYFLVLILYYYFLVYIVVLLFTYYEEEFTP